MTPNDSSGELSPKELAALTAIFEERTFTAAAKRAGITRKTLYRFLERPAFRQAVRDGVSRALDGLYVSLASGRDDALDTLRGLITDKNTGEATRRLAASDWITFFAKLGERLEYQELTERLADIEQALKGSH